jgi:MATE family multidrug resistance protein
LIYGKFGFPQLGIFGAGLATFTSRLLTPIAIFIYIKYHTTYSKYLKLFSIKSISQSIVRSVLKIGMPISGQMVIETISFSVIILFFGWVSTEDLAAAQIVITFVTTTYLMCCGLANATTVLVSYSVGKGDTLQTKRYSKSGWHLALVFMTCTMIAFIFGGERLASVFSNDQAVIQKASLLFVIAGLFQLFDGSQASLLGALRGLKDVRVPMQYAFIAYIVITLPVSYIMGFTFALGSWAILFGLAFGLSFAATLYYCRLNKTLSRLS